MERARAEFAKQFARLAGNASPGSPSSPNIFLMGRPRRRGLMPRATWPHAYRLRAAPRRALRTRLAPALRFATIRPALLHRAAVYKEVRDARQIHKF